MCDIPFLLFRLIVIQGRNRIIQRVTEATLCDNDLLILSVVIIRFLVAVLQEIIHILCGIEEFVADFGIGQESVVSVSAQGGIVDVQQFLDFGIGVERLAVACPHLGAQALEFRFHRIEDRKHILHDSRVRR